VCGFVVYTGKLNSLSGCVFCNILLLLFLSKKYEGLVRIFVVPNSVLTVSEGGYGPSKDALLAY